MGVLFVSYWIKVPTVGMGVNDTPALKNKGKIALVLWKEQKGGCGFYKWLRCI